MSILPQLLVNALISGSIYALAGAGLSLTFGLLRVLNFAHGHLMMAGSYFFYLATAMLGLSLLSSSLATCVFSILLALVVLNVFVKPFYEINFFLSLVTTLSLSYILESAVSMIFGVNVKSLYTGNTISSIEFHGVYITPIQISIILSAVGLLSILAYLVHNTSFGRRIRALSECSFGAEAIGINKAQIHSLVFVLGTLLASFAGVMVGYETNIQPTMGHIYTIKSFAAMILGGLGNIWGTVAGAYFIGLIENLSIGLDFGSYSLPAGYKDAFSFVIILVVLIFRPQGIFGKSRRMA